MIDRDGFRAWKERVFGTEYMIWHDGLCTDLVADLRGAERDEALAMLRFGVEIGDTHASEALAAMGDPTMLEAMRALMASGPGSSRVRATLAVHRLQPDEALAEHLIDVLRGGEFWSNRIDAAIGLRHFRDPSSEQALLEAIATDPEYLVRFHASDTLLLRWRVKPSDISKHREIFQRIAGPREGTPSPEHFEQFREARAMIEALRP